jgi:beta-1,4-mannosyl-glycoprotein beta-1,4-N-acetylglucosaminyltransferase
MVSDVDEVPRASTLSKVQDAFRPGDVYLLQCASYHFSLNRREAGVVWDGARLLERRLFPGGQKTRALKARASKKWVRLGLSPLGVRKRNWERCGLFKRAIPVPDAGWHFSSLGDYARWCEKVDAYSHPELKQSAEYGSAQAFAAKVAALTIEPLSSMPAIVREESRLQKLLA